MPPFSDTPTLHSGEDITRIYGHIRKQARRIASRFPVPAFYSDFFLAGEFSRRLFVSDPLLRDLRNYAFFQLDEDFGHGSEHARKVSLDAGTLVFAEYIGSTYSLDYIRRRMFLAQCAGLFHDIRRKEKNHAGAGADFTANLLKQYPLRPREIEDIAQAIRNHEAFKDISPVHTPEGLLISDCLYDADKFRWGPDNFQNTVWDMVIFLKIPLEDFMKKYPAALQKIASVKKTFRSETGKKYGPQFIDTGLAIGKELYAEILREFGACL